MKVMLVYQNDRAYLIRVSRLNLNPSNCIRNIISTGNHDIMVKEAKEILKNRNAIKTAYCNKIGNILLLKWEWGSGDKTRTIVSSRQNQLNNVI